jgi:hypothetical protein
MRQPFCFSNGQKPPPGYWFLLTLRSPSAAFAQIMYVQLQFFDHLAHNLIAKGLKLLERCGGPDQRPIDSIAVL